MNNLQSIIRRLTKKFPEAKIKQTMDGKYFVQIKNVNIFDEYLIPYADDIETVWTRYDECVKQMDTSMRVHPYRIDKYDDEDKRKRINNRRRKSINLDIELKRKFEKEISKYENENY